MQTTIGGSYLVADTYCKARKGALLHSVTDLTHNFISSELERFKGRLKSKLVWLGARRENNSPSTVNSISPGSISALSDQVGPRSLLASLDEFDSHSPLTASIGPNDGSESSPIHSLRAQRALYQASSGAGGTFSRGSQTFGLPTPSQSHSLNRSAEHMQRSLIISQPSQVASSFFVPPTPLSTSSQSTQTTQSVSPSHAPTLSSSGTSHALHNPTSFHIQRIHKQSLPAPSTSSSVSASSAQATWIQSPPASPQTHQSQSVWRWGGDMQSESLQDVVTSFLWADDQPNNYNNQQDCIVMDGTKKWLWNDVTCELDYLPWVCQYRPSTCGSPDRQENSTILEIHSSLIEGSSSESNFQLGKVVTYTCPIGHKLEGPKQRKCLYDGTWSDRAPRCQYVDCGQLNSQSIENGQIVYLNQSQTTYASLAKYVCHEDYVLVGSDIRQCNADGRWSNKQPFCAYKWCPALPQITNGLLNVSSYRENSIATYTCNNGFKLIGNDTRQCLLGGKWTNHEPFCQFVDCGQPKEISNGKYELVNKTTNYLSVTLYTCNDNYTLSGVNNKLVCQHTNRWTGREPECNCKCQTCF